MCGSGTTIDVAKDLDRRARGFDLQPQRDDIDLADARDAWETRRSTLYLSIRPIRQTLNTAMIPVVLVS